MNWLEICDRFITPAERMTTLARKILPDLNGQPLYVITGDEVPDLLADRGISFYSPVGDLMFRPHLERTGRWQGRGPAILIDCPPETFVAVAIHELAHAAEAISTPNADPLPEVDDETSQRVERIFYLSPANPLTMPTHTGKPKWFQHGAEFVRVALHLRYRAERLGVRFTTNAAAIAGPQYGLSCGRLFDHSLGPELTTFGVERPIGDLRDIEPPAEFTELFQKDTTRKQPRHVAA